MYDHIGIKVGDLDASVRFYTAALAPLGYVLCSRDEGGAGCKDPHHGQGTLSCWHLVSFDGSYWVGSRAPTGTGQSGHDAVMSSPRRCLSRPASLEHRCILRSKFAPS